MTERVGQLMRVASLCLSVSLDLTLSASVTCGTFLLVITLLDVMAPVDACIIARRIPGQVEQPDNTVTLRRRDSLIYSRTSILYCALRPSLISTICSSYEVLAHRKALARAHLRNCHFNSISLYPVGRANTDT